MAIEVFAPAKVNLTLHVTGQRADGYHLLDSVVMFADFGDHLRVAKAAEMSLRVTGPLAHGVPEDARNLCWRAAEAFGEPVAIELDKHLPHAAGIGGGSSDAAAVLRAMEQLFERPFSGDPLKLGADIPVCLHASAARMAGIGEDITGLSLPAVHAVLVNPRVDVPTPAVFKALPTKDNPPMGEIPRSESLAWLAAQRNDMEAAAAGLAPEIQTTLDALAQMPNQCLTRMSGSGATCFALFETRALADHAAQMLATQYPNWWVQSATLT
jgi:4-diphosphocytidyl-2-C-methyl-D-erythritol kinase